MFGFGKKRGRRKKLKQRRKLPLRFDPPSLALPMQAWHVQAYGSVGPARPERVNRSLSQLSHGLIGGCRTMASIPDTWQDADRGTRIPTHWPDTFH